MLSNFHVRSPWSRSSGRLLRRLRGWSTSHENKLRELGLFSLEKSWVRGDLINVCENLQGGGRGWARLFSAVPSNRARGNGWDRCPGSSSWEWGRTSSQCVTEPCNRLPREGVESSKDCLHANLCPVLQDDPAWTGWTRRATTVSSNLTCSVITWRTVLCCWVFF